MTAATGFEFKMIRQRVDAVISAPVAADIASPCYASSTIRPPAISAASPRRKPRAPLCRRARQPTGDEQDQRRQDQQQIAIIQIERQNAHMRAQKAERYRAAARARPRRTDCASFPALQLANLTQMPRPGAAGPSAAADPAATARAQANRPRRPSQERWLSQPGSGALLTAACKKMLASGRAPSQISSAAPKMIGEPSTSRSQSRRRPPRATRSKRSSGAKSAACCLLQKASPSARPASPQRPERAKYSAAADPKQQAHVGQAARAVSEQ